jgi:phosphoglycerate dehydrogenase-like enzyme
MVKVVVSQSIVDDIRSLLDEVPDSRTRPGSADVELLAVDSKAAGADLTAADAAIRWDLDDDGFQTLLEQATELRWLHSPGAGIERWPLAELAERKIILTNAAGVFAIPIAEWVLTTMLTAVKQTHLVREAQQGRRWADDIPADELYGKTLLVLGTGGIGQEIINRAAAFGMRIWGSNRKGRPVDNTERVVQGDAWRDLLPEADFVVSTLPLTAETTKMISTAELDSFKPGAWLLNVGRGATIDEDALVHALREQTLGGAALDAWTTEPLPSDHPAWALPTMVVSPHMSGSSPAGRDRGLRLFADNIRRFAADEPMTNVVDLAVGY